MIADMGDDTRVVVCSGCGAMSDPVPVRPGGNPGAAANIVRAAARRINGFTRVPGRTWDDRCSTCGPEPVATPPTRSPPDSR